MTKESTQSTGKNPVKMFGMIAPYLPGLLLRSGTAWLSFKRQANKGGREFKKELLRQGIEKESADLLTRQYLESSMLIKYFKDVE